MAILGVLRVTRAGAAGSGTVPLILVLFLAIVSSALPLSFSTFNCGELSQAVIHENPSRLSIIKSPNFPHKYLPSVNCLYKIQRTSESVCSATFLFNLFDLETSRGCRKDFIELNGERLCGPKATGYSKIVSFGNSNEIGMRFVADNETNGLGFLVAINQQDCPTLGACGQVLYTQPRFVLTSPDYPLAYSNNKKCKYIVIKANPRICKLRMKIRAFDVEHQKHCDNDYLQLNDLNRVCGIQEKGHVIDQPFPGERLEMTFVSDSSTTRDGFHVDVYQVSCHHHHQSHQVRNSSNAIS